MGLKLSNLKNHWSKLYSHPEFYELNRWGHVIDLRKGGLVLGASHLWGGIYCYGESKSLFEIIAEIEGGEFVVNSLAAERYHDRLMEINNDTSGPTRSLDRKFVTDCFVVQNNKNQCIWMNPSGVWIINAKSTAKYYEELKWMNSLDEFNKDVVVNNSAEWKFLENLDLDGRFYDVFKQRPDDFIKKIRSKGYMDNSVA